MTESKPVRSYRFSHRAPIYYLFFSVVCQILGMGVLLFLNAMNTPAVSLLGQCFTAFFAARWLKLPVVWQVFNLVLTPAIVAYEFLSLPSWLALAALVISVLMYLPTFWTRVPYFPTSPKMYELIAAQLPEGKVLRFVDLGCGFGTLLTFLAKRRPEATFYGVELSPLPFLVAKLRARFAGEKRVKVEIRNLWNVPLGEFDIVYAFLSPIPMPYLWEKVKEEMKPGSIFITNTFSVGAKPSATLKVDDSHQDALYVHRM